MIVLCSGGFDPLHSGHVEYLRRASELGDVYAVVNSDAWLVRKKGFAFMSWEERAAIVGALKFVKVVSRVDDADGTVCEAIKRIKPDIVANGGDRVATNTPEESLCQSLGIKSVYGLGEKTQSSSNLVAMASGGVTRDWGVYRTLYKSDDFKVKALTVRPGGEITKQRHQKRAEHWLFKDGHRYIPVGEWHRFQNTTDKPIEFIEVQVGECVESDIERA